MTQFEPWFAVEPPVCNDRSHLGCGDNHTILIAYASVIKLHLFVHHEQIMCLALRCIYYCKASSLNLVVHVCCNGVLAIIRLLWIDTMRPIVWDPTQYCHANYCSGSCGTVWWRSATHSNHSIHEKFPTTRFARKTNIPVRKVQLVYRCANAPAVDTQTCHSCWPQWWYGSKQLWTGTWTKAWVTSISYKVSLLLTLIVHCPI